MGNTREHSDAGKGGVTLMPLWLGVVPGACIVGGLVCLVILVASPGDADPIPMGVSGGIVLLGLIELAGWWCAPGMLARAPSELLLFVHRTMNAAWGRRAEAAAPWIFGIGTVVLLAAGAAEWGLEIVVVAMLWAEVFVAWAFAQQIRGALERVLSQDDTGEVSRSQ